MNTRTDSDFEQPPYSIMNCGKPSLSGIRKEGGSLGDVWSNSLILMSLTFLF